MKGPYHLRRTPIDLRNQDGKTPKSLEKVQQSARQVHQRVYARMGGPGKGTWARNTDKTGQKPGQEASCPPV